MPSYLHVSVHIDTAALTEFESIDMQAMHPVRAGLRGLDLLQDGFKGVVIFSNLPRGLAPVGADAFCDAVGISEDLK